MSKDKISFGKGKSINFYNQGIAKDSFKTDDPKKQKLTESIFKKYDKNHDGILDIEELNDIKSELKSAAGINKKIGEHEANKFLRKNLGLDKNYNSEDLFEILEFLDSDTDDILNAKTKDNITVINYKPDEKGQRKAETYNNNGAKPRLEKVVISTPYNAKVTTTTYDERGQIEALTVKKGNLTEFYDPETGKIVRSEERSGNKFFEYKEYEYDLDDGSGNKFDRVSRVNYTGNKTVTDKFADKTSVESRYDEDGRLTLKIEYDEKDKKVSETKYNPDDTWVRLDFKNGRTEKTTGKIKTVAEKVETEEKVENKQPVPYTVNKDNDTWYGIVQAKYGITDHETTMAIVHQLKTLAKVSRKDKNIPDIINLPPKVTVSNTEYELKDIDAEVNPIHFHK